MRFIKLDNGCSVIVDNEDYDRLNRRKWQASSSGRTIYAVRRITMPDKKRKLIFLHHEVLGYKPPKGLVVDHADRNSLNCRRGNLRVCTHSQNSANKPPNHLNKGSKYKGVWCVVRRNNDKRWRTSIKCNNKTYSLGCFADEYSAVKIYNVWAYRLYGKYAYLNKWDGPTRSGHSGEKRLSGGQRGPGETH